jgi:hypothetical protein
MSITTSSWRLNTHCQALYSIIWPFSMRCPLRCGTVGYIRSWSFCDTVCQTHWITCSLFVDLAYSILALEMDSAPPFEETWIESLGDLARYRTAIEEPDLRDREVWSAVSRMWYNKAADESLDTGIISPPLAVLAPLGSELLESDRDRRHGSTSNDDNIDHNSSTPRARVNNIVTYPSAWEGNTAHHAQEHSTGYFDLQAHQLEHLPGAEDVGLVPEGIDNNDPGLEADNKSVRDQLLDSGEPRPLPEDFLLTGQVYASCWHDPELGGDLPWFSGQPGSGQEALQSIVDNPDKIAFNEWIGVDGYDNMDLGLVLYNEDALSPIQADIMPSNDDYLPGMDWTVRFFAVVPQALPIGTAENLLNVIREGVLSEEREGIQTSHATKSAISPRTSKLVATIIFSGPTRTWIVPRKQQIQ